MTSKNSFSESDETPSLIITAGEPAGIGPDLVLSLQRKDIAARLSIVADANLLRERAKQIGVAFSIPVIESNTTLPPTGPLQIIHQPLPSPAESGRLNPAHADYVLQTIAFAVDQCRNGNYDALVTGPVHKGVINQAGIPFTGHTEYLAQLCESESLMMLQTPRLRVALATTHLPLNEVSRAITRPLLQKTLMLLHNELQRRLGLATPSIYVCGLNPHAGEDGHLGREEIEIITPVLQELRLRGLNITGPLAADTLFLEKNLVHADVVLAMYHDQGLPVLKASGFGQSVNITLGLPIIRTSVDHGTALELAGSGNADPSSLLYAIQTAITMAENSSKTDVTTSGNPA